MNYPVAIRLTYLAATTAVISALVTTALVGCGAVPAIYAGHAILLAGLAWGIIKCSRICASLLVVYWIATKIFQLIATPDAFSGLGRAIALLALGAFVAGLFATIVYHRRGLG